jgi:plastocyanin
MVRQGSRLCHEGWLSRPDARALHGGGAPFPAHAGKDCVAQASLPAEMGIGKGPRLLLLALMGVAAAALGAATALVPAVAGSEAAPTVTAENVGLYGHYWRPASVQVAPGGAVQISNNTNVPHGVHWLNGPGTPECNGVIVGTKETESGTNWSGTCTFAAAGTYTFDCTVHGEAMKGTVTVGAEGVTTTSTTTTSTPTTSTTTTTPVIPTGAQTLLAGSAASALRFSSAAHGSRLLGTIDLGPQGAGARLDASAFAARGALGRRHGPQRVRVAHVAETSLPQGVSRFTLVLSSAARRALHARSRLRLTIQLQLEPSAGGGLTLTRALTVRR